MSVKIRLKRAGSKGRPFYRVVVIDSRMQRDGRFIEELGYYDPLEKPQVFNVDRDKAQMWLARGAQPSDTVFNLLKRPKTPSWRASRTVISRPAPSARAPARRRRTSPARARMIGAADGVVGVVRVAGAAAVVAAGATRARKPRASRPSEAADRVFSRKS